MHEPPSHAVSPPQHTHHAEPVSFDERFKPLRPEDRWKIAAGVIVGPVLWIVAIAVATYLVHKTDAIELGLLITLCSFALSMIVLSTLRIGRGREERRYESRHRT